MRYGRQKQRRKSLVVMFCAWTLLFLYLANTVPVLRVLLYFISSVFIFGVMMEHMALAAFISFFAVGFLGFLLVPNQAGMLPYLFFFGHYGIFKYLIDGGRGGAAAIAAKLVYFNAGAALIYFFGGGFLLAQLPWNLPLWFLVILAEVIFLLYDWLFGKLAGWYYANVRNRLLAM